MNGPNEITTKFRQYYKDMHAIWEDYFFQDHYLKELHTLIKNDSIPILKFQSLFGNNEHPYLKKFSYGVIDRLTKKSLFYKTLLAIVSTTENFLQAITYRLYLDFQYKLQTTIEGQERNQKLLNIILESETKEIIVSKISEEKIRGVFYGNAADFFAKDKANIGFGSYISNTYKLALIKYSEIIARRNLYAHSDGRVDRKYLKETENSPFTLGQKAIIDKTYVKESIQILVGLTTIVTQQALKVNYKATLGMKDLRHLINFEKHYKGK